MLTILSLDEIREVSEAYAQADSLNRAGLKEGRYSEEDLFNYFVMNYMFNALFVKWEPRPDNGVIGIIARVCSYYYDLNSQQLKESYIKVFRDKSERMRFKPRFS